MNKILIEGCSANEKWTLHYVLIDGTKDIITNVVFVEVDDKSYVIEESNDSLTLLPTNQVKLIKITKNKED